jgi:hypothetical protein
MRTRSQAYVLTLPSTPPSILGLWNGKSLHALRHCSATQVGQVLTEMQQHSDGLRQPAKPTNPAMS